MTAEVALLNKHAVALAADSAVTISGRRGSKVYNAANKLFALSKREPVGIMVYGNAEYMGIPWETIIKIYRSELGDGSFPHLQEYYEHFMAFIGTNDHLFGYDVQQRHAFQVARRVLEMIKNDVRMRIDSATKGTDDGIDLAAIPAIQSQVIQNVNQILDSQPRCPGFDDTHVALVREAYADTIDQAVGIVFEEIQLSPEDKTSLQDSVVHALTRDTIGGDEAGVVIAGFGRAEPFPSVRSATVDARVAGRIKYREGGSATISHDTGAVVMPFAQRDAVDLFINGIDQQHATHATRLVQRALNGLADQILASLEMGEEDQALAAEKWRELAEQHLRNFSDEAQAWRREHWVNPLLDVIEVLPKDELAALAEALVNITSLRRKVRMETETVGGPIDVAVISKGDGLVWIHRKHYFTPQLNPHFFTNYFRLSPLVPQHGEGQ